MTHGGQWEGGGEGRDEGANTIPGLPLSVWRSIGRSSARSHLLGLRQSAADKVQHAKVGRVDADGRFNGVRIDRLELLQHGVALQQGGFLLGTHVERAVVQPEGGQQLRDLERPIAGQRTVAGNGFLRRQHMSVGYGEDREGR